MDKKVELEAHGYASTLVGTIQHDTFLLDDVLTFLVFLEAVEGFGVTLLPSRPVTFTRSCLCLLLGIVLALDSTAAHCSSQSTGIQSESASMTNSSTSEEGSTMAEV